MQRPSRCKERWARSAPRPTRGGAQQKSIAPRAAGKIPPISRDSLGVSSPPWTTPAPAQYSSPFVPKRRCQEPGRTVRAVAPMRSHASKLICALRRGATFAAIVVATTTVLFSTSSTPASRSPPAARRKPMGCDRVSDASRCVCFRMDVGRD